LPFRTPVVLAGLFALALMSCARRACADMVTPGSITPPPSGWVTDQYKGLGLVFYPMFPDNVANGQRLNVATYYDGGGWTPYTTGASTASGSAPWTWQSTQPNIAGGPQSVGFVMPGTGAPATTDSLRVQVYSGWNDGLRSELTLDAFGIDGKRVGSLDVLVGSSSTTWLAFRAPGIHSFTIDENWWFPTGSPPQRVFNSPYYSITAIEFSPVATVPEPGSLALFGLGGLALIGDAWARRKRRMTTTSMKTPVCLALVSALVLRTAGRARAEVIAFCYTSSSVTVVGTGPLAQRLAAIPGLTFSGTFSYDRAPAGLDRSGSGYRAGSVSLSLAGQTFSSDPGQPISLSLTSTQFTIQGFGPPGGANFLVEIDGLLGTYSPDALPTQFALWGASTAYAGVTLGDGSAGAWGWLDSVARQPDVRGAPEPGSLALFGLGGLALIGGAWARRKRQGARHGPFLQVSIPRPRQVRLSPEGGWTRLPGPPRHGGTGHAPRPGPAADPCWPAPGGPCPALSFPLPRGEPRRWGGAQTGAHPRRDVPDGFPEGRRRFQRRGPAARGAD
jgi:hypothetical protein